MIKPDIIVRNKTMHNNTLAIFIQNTNDSKNEELKQYCFNNNILYFIIADQVNFKYYDALRSSNPLDYVETIFSSEKFLEVFGFIPMLQLEYFAVQILSILHILPTIYLTDQKRLKIEPFSGLFFDLYSLLSYPDDEIEFRFDDKTELGIGNFLS